MDAGHAAAVEEADAGAPRKKKAAATRRRQEGEDARELTPVGPPEDAGGKDAALAECAASCCVFCACLPVSLLCCVARAPLRAARRCCRWRTARKRRPPRRLAPGGSSSSSDAELGDFRQGRRRGMADGDDRPRSRSPCGSQSTAARPSLPPQQPPPRDRRR